MCTTTRTALPYAAGILAVLIGGACLAQGGSGPTSAPPQAAGTSGSAMPSSAEPSAHGWTAPPSTTHFGFGTDVDDKELAQFTSPLPDGRGLPAGSGTVMQGQKVYSQQCLACHGANLEGGIGDRLIGGRDSLVGSGPSKPPIKTVESYWPYATTLFDYIKRAMPFTSPNSLSNDDVYAVSAYILYKANIVPEDATMDKDSLAKVKMPNRDGFIPANR